MLSREIAKSLRALFDIQVTATNLLSTLAHVNGRIDGDRRAAFLKVQQEAKEAFEKLLTVAQGGIVTPASGENDNESIH